MHIDYTINAPVSAAQFIDLLERSTLGARRPIDDLACIEGMLANSNRPLPPGLANSWWAWPVR